MDAEQRPIFSYSTHLLSARDDMLIKNLVRLISHRSQHTWAYTTSNPSLNIIGDAIVSKAEAQLLPQTANAKLMVVHSPHRSEPFLLLPLHAQELIDALDKIGAKLSAANTISNASQTDAAVFIPRISTRGVHQYRLTSWPPRDLIKTPARIKLATIMLGGYYSVEKLQMRSDSSADDCSRFVQEMQAAGLVTQLEPEVPVTVSLVSTIHAFAAASIPKPKIQLQSGLLARIRLRLGL